MYSGKSKDNGIRKAFSSLLDGDTLENHEQKDNALSVAISGQLRTDIVI